MINTVGGLIFELRSRLGINQQEMAGYLGVSRVTLSYWENDRHVPSKLGLHSLRGLLSSFGADLLSDLDRLTGQTTSFGALLVSIRLQLNVSQEELAELLGVSRIIVHRWENGQAASKFAVDALIRFLSSADMDDLLAQAESFLSPSSED